MRAEKGTVLFMERSNGEKKNRPLNFEISVYIVNITNLFT